MSLWSKGGTARANTSVLALVIEKKNEAWSYAWLDKTKNDLLVTFSRSCRGIFLHTMDTTEHKLIYWGTWNQVKNDSSATEDMLTFIIPVAEDQTTIL